MHKSFNSRLVDLSIFKVNNLTSECDIEDIIVLFFRITEDHVIQHGLVVDGTSLSLALREHEKLFMEVCRNCSAVLCCRMAPLQKAKVSIYHKKIP